MYLNVDCFSFNRAPKFNGSAILNHWRVALMQDFDELFPFLHRIAAAENIIIHVIVTFREGKDEKKETCLDTGGLTLYHTWTNEKFNITVSVSLEDYGFCSFQKAVICVFISCDHVDYLQQNVEHFSDHTTVTELLQECCITLEGIVQCLSFQSLSPWVSFFGPFCLR